MGRSGICEFCISLVVDVLVSAHFSGFQVVINTPGQALVGYGMLCFSEKELQNT